MTVEAIRRSIASRDPSCARCMALRAANTAALMASSRASPSSVSMSLKASR